MLIELKVGSISWIHAAHHPMTMWGAKAGILNPDWIPKTYLGLVATKNNMPPDTIKDFRQFEKQKDFRALMLCHIKFNVDSVGNVTKFEVVDALHNPGFTPPFNVNNFPLPQLDSEFRRLLDNKWHPGEASPISLVYTERRHSNSSIGVIPENEKVLINGLIKFRAGKQTDDIGIKTVKCPFHVPWVWNEFLVTLRNGRIKIYTKASIFPTHHWYVNGLKVVSQSEISDSHFPKKSGDWTKRTIDETKLALFPVLKTGAPANIPQVAAAADKAIKFAVDKHPFTVKGGKILVKKI
jgi:hypothetical protein